VINTIDIEIAIVCDECENDLDIEDIDDPRRSDYRAIVRVKPCSDCLDAAREDGRKETREEAKEEVTA